MKTRLTGTARALTGKTENRKKVQIPTPPTQLLAYPRCNRFAMPRPCGAVNRANRGGFVFKSVLMFWFRALQLRSHIKNKCAPRATVACASALAVRTTRFLCRTNYSHTIRDTRYRLHFFFLGELVVKAVGSLCPKQVSNFRRRRIFRNL